MDSQLPPKDSAPSTSNGRRPRARGTDTSFATQPDPRMVAEIDSVLDRAIRRGIEMFEMELAERTERRFYSGRR